MIFLVSKFISLFLTRILMMTTWKYEGRSAIILMAFVVQTLFIINGGKRINQTGRLKLFLEFTISPHFPSLTIRFP